MFKVDFVIEDKKLPLALRAIASVGGIQELNSVPIPVETGPKKLTKATRAVAVAVDAAGNKVSRFDQIVKLLGKKEFTRKEFAEAGETLGYHKKNAGNFLFKAGQEKRVKKVTGKKGHWKLT